MLLLFVVRHFEPIFKIGIGQVRVNNYNCFLLEAVPRQKSESSPLYASSRAVFFCLRFFCFVLLLVETVFFLFLICRFTSRFGSAHRFIVPVKEYTSCLPVISAYQHQEILSERISISAFLKEEQPKAQLFFMFIMSFTGHPTGWRRAESTLVVSHLIELTASFHLIIDKDIMALTCLVRRCSFTISGLWGPYESLIFPA